ncbi:MAG: hypothetical protein EON87_01425 [Brevundimonas sp.]|nr:MAG: hypothetical protein EON87_01425 [Brevundimonas sp.]
MRLAAFLAAAVVALAASSAAAQTPGGGGGPQPMPGTSPPSRDDAARTTANAIATDPERLGRTPTSRRRNALAAAREAVATASLACEVASATHVGQAGETDVYEIVCADAPGWLVLTGTPIQTFNCLALEVGGDGETRCATAANKDAVRAMAGYVRTLGLTCRVTKAGWIGRLPEGADRYEVLCDGGDGYWIEADGDGRPLQARPCAEVTTAGGTCRLRP